MRVRIFGLASRDIASAVAWWRVNRPLAPLCFEEELSAALSRIEENPFSAPAAKELRLKSFRWLSLLETRYFLYYRVNETRDQVEVLRLWHMSRRRPPVIR